MHSRGAGASGVAGWGRGGIGCRHGDEKGYGSPVKLRAGTGDDNTGECCGAGNTVEARRAAEDRGIEEGFGGG